MVKSIDLRKGEVKQTQRPIRVLLAVYGTLRLGCNNWNSYLKGKSNYIGFFYTRKGYTMYNTGHFPIVVDKGNNQIRCDVFEVRSKHVLEELNSLEGCTGIPGDPKNYYDIQPIDTPHGRAWMYLMHEEMHYEEIHSGDWLKRVF